MLILDNKYMTQLQLVVSLVILPVKVTVQERVPSGKVESEDQVVQQKRRSFTKRERLLHGITITPSIIRRQFYHNKIENHYLTGGQESPLEEIEPIILEIIHQMARIRQCLIPSRSL